VWKVNSPTSDASTSEASQGGVPWRRTIRRETGLVENICEHGIGHPAYGSALYQDAIRGDEDGAWGVHGCDGCCQDPEWHRLDLEMGLRIATSIVVRLIREKDEQ